MEKINKYNPEEVLLIFQANYKQQQQRDPEVELCEELTFETTVLEWRNICDLVSPRELSVYFNYYFELDFPVEKWILILEPQKTKTLREVCEFISENALRPLIKPVKLFGSDCKMAATFKFLMNRFESKGADVKDIKPSSLLEPFVKKYLPLVIEEVNKLNSSTLPVIAYKNNLISETGIYVSLIAFLLLIVSIWVPNLTLSIVSSFGLGFLFLWIGSRFSPAKASFKGINTFRDLVIKIENNCK